MQIRTKILIGYGYLVMLLLAAAVGASVGFFRLGAELTDAIGTGLVGVGPEIDLLEALELQHDLLVEGVLGDQKSEHAFEAAHEDFMRLLGELRGGGSAERDAVVEIRSDSTAFETVCGAFFESDDRGSLYRSVVFPAYETLRSDVIALIDLSEERLAQTGSRLRAEASRRAIGHAVIVVVALLSLVLISRVLQVTVLDRLDELRRLALAIDLGDLNRRASVEQRDELGLVAEQLNNLLDAWQDVQGEAKGEGALQKQLLLALIEAWPEPVAVTRLDGRLVASTLGEDDQGTIKEAVRSEIKSGKWQILPLVAPGDRPVGWLVSKNEISDS
jgi:HAMP domain-containing protein